jgi:hypothetical protein
LFLRKASGQTAHGGGVRIRPGTEDFETIRGWIAAGAPFGDPNAPRVVAIRVEPRERVLPMRGRQSLRVIASYSDRRETDVTRHAKFQTNNENLALVDASGLVQTLDNPGDVAVMASYLGNVDTFRAIIPLGRVVRGAWRVAREEKNFIDVLVDRKLAKLNIEPSAVCDDGEFVRRVYLDVIGTLPTPVETRRFLADKTSDKRAKLVDALLNRPEFADYWALKWADLLRVDRQALGHQRAYAFYQWIRDSFASNKPFDRFARELLTADGPLAEIGPANFYKVVTKPGEMASTLSQVFLGVRIACAECHHHPYDRWSQTDYYGMQAFFTPIRVQGTKENELLLAVDAGPSKHPRTGEAIFAHALGTASPSAATNGDRRAALADWVVSPDNPFFARNLANRVWAHFMGRGLVEPVDDIRATNPPTNPELLDALAKHSIENKYDFRELIRTVTASRVYQTSSQTNATNERDEQNGSRALLKQLDAEVLLDMVCQTTGVPEKFGGAATGTRAIQLWDSRVNHYFLKQFGRPQRVSSCECERNCEPNVAQVLHLLNSPEIQAKLSHEGGTVSRLVSRIENDGKLVEEMYLMFFSRFPTDVEAKAATAYLKRPNRRQAAEDLAWGMLNSLEFRFNH